MRILKKFEREARELIERQKRERPELGRWAFNNFHGCLPGGYRWRYDHSQGDEWLNKMREYKFPPVKQSLRDFYADIVKACVESRIECEMIEKLQKRLDPNLLVELAIPIRARLRAMGYLPKDIGG